MIGYFVNLTLAAGVAAVAHAFHWWLPAVIFPVWILLSPSRPLQPQQVTVRRVTTMRWYFYVLGTAYAISQAVIFHIHIASWWGWLLGLVLGWIVGGILAGKLEPQLLHRGLP
jgi:hypothetical protein